MRISPEGFANKLSRDRKVPIDIISIMDDCGVAFLPESGIEQKNFAGITLVNDKIRVVSANNNVRALRKRFILAHEFGHALMHGNISGVFIDASFENMVTFDNVEPKRLRFEKEATRFAINLLVPKKYLLLDLERQDIKELFFEDKIDVLAKKYNVEKWIINYRLAQILNDNSF